MLYKHDIEDRSDTIVGKIWFSYLIQKHTQRKQQIHGSTSIMNDKHVTMNSRIKKKMRTLMQ